MNIELVNRLASYEARKRNESYYEQETRKEKTGIEETS